MPKPTLTFGANALIPETAVAAWGARAIDHGGVDFDLPHDRVSIAGTSQDKARLLPLVAQADPLAVYREAGCPPALMLDGDGFGFGATRQGGYVYFAAWVI